MSENPFHSMREDRWYTPPDVVERARRTLDGIDFDPASDEHGNNLVQAMRIRTREQNGLLPWPSTQPAYSVFMNPPGGLSTDRVSLPLLFWARLMLERQAGRISHAIVIAFTLEQLSRTQGHGIPCMLDFPLCIPRKRIRYWTPEGKIGPSPTHSGAIVYVPGTIDRSEEFAAQFEPLGKVVRPPESV